MERTLRVSHGGGAGAKNLIRRYILIRAYSGDAGSRRITARDDYFRSAPHTIRRKGAKRWAGYDLRTRGFYIGSEDIGVQGATWGVSFEE